MKKEDYIQKGYNLGYADGLAHGKLEGEDAAEERIIKLLEAQSHDLLFQEHEPSACCLCTHLRLVKGEQK